MSEIDRLDTDEQPEEDLIPFPTYEEWCSMVKLAQRPVEQDDLRWLIDDESEEA